MCGSCGVELEEEMKLYSGWSRLVKDGRVVKVLWVEMVGGEVMFWGEV